MGEREIFFDNFSLMNLCFLLAVCFFTAATRRRRKAASFSASRRVNNDLFITTKGENRMNATTEMTSDITLTDAEAFAGVVIASAASDQRISEKEVKFVYFMFSRMQLFREWTHDQYDAMFSKLMGVLKEKKLDAFLDLCVQFLPKELYRTVFAASLDLVVVDGFLSDEEKDFLYELQRKLGLDTDTANKIIEVILIKNRG